MKKDVIIATIKAESIDVLPAHDLVISAACSYYGVTKDELLSASMSREHSRRKGLVFYVIREMCQMTPKDIARVCNTSRQNAAHAIGTAEGQVKVYLLSICDYRNIKGIYSDLLKKQEECLRQLLPRSSSTP